jgi:hypothetical protein
MVLGTTVLPGWSLLRKHFFRTPHLEPGQIVVTVIVRACAIHSAQVTGLWLQSVFWSRPFELLIMPVQCASKAAADIAELVAVAGVPSTSRGQPEACSQLHSRVQ